MTEETEAVNLGPVVVKHETDKALLVRMEDQTERWIPKSQIHDDSDVYRKNQDGELKVTKWFAEKEGLA